MTEAPQWFTSSYSENGGACVEVAVNVAPSRGVVPVRDTKDRARAGLNLPAGSFASFVASVRGGELGSL